MSIQAVESPQSSDLDAPDIFHFYCCDPDVAYCGIDVSDDPETDGTKEQHCVVCEQIQDVRGDDECAYTCKQPTP